MSTRDDAINRAAHTIMVKSWGEMTEEHPEGVGGFGSPPVDLVQAVIGEVLAAASAKDEAKQVIIDILHGHGATVGAGGETAKWEDCEYAAIHEMAATRIVERLVAGRLLL